MGREWDPLGERIAALEAGNARLREAIENAMAELLQVGGVRDGHVGYARYYLREALAVKP